MLPILYGAAALFGYSELKKRRKAKQPRGHTTRVATSRRRNCGTNSRCNCRSH